MAQHPHGQPPSAEGGSGGPGGSEAAVPFDSGVAVRVAQLVAGGGPSISDARRKRIRRDLHEFTHLSDGLVRSFTGLEPPGTSPAPAVIGRTGWIRLNVEGMHGLLEPLAEKVARASALGRRTAGAALGFQAGIVLGYLGRKVLGQYDALFAPPGSGRVYYVGPNIADVEEREQLTPHDFRLWIALHEVTHRVQFTAVPWLRDHVRSLIGRYLGGMEIDRDRMRAALRDLAATMRRGSAPRGPTDLFAVLLTPEQREVLGSLQALMSVVEGHGNFVMDQVGAERIPTYARMKQALKRRRSRAGAAQRTVERALGLEMKYEQYVVGESFVAAVATDAGMEGVNRLWERAENFPTIEELRDPNAWLVRVGADGGSAPGT